MRRHLTFTAALPAARPLTVWTLGTWAAAYTMALTLVSSADAQNTGAYRILAPATTGGGYDTFARNVSRTLDVTKLAPGTTVYNIPGEGGVVGLREFVKQRGQGRELIVFGVTTIAALQTSKDAAGLSLKDLTPVARLTNDYEVLVVPAGSPYKTLSDLTAAFKGNPALRFGGASVASAGHLFTANVMQASGGNVKNLRWIPSSGNLQAVRAMLNGELDVVSSSYGVAEPEMRAGRVRALALSAPTRVEGIDVPTAREQGVAAELVNWRGVFAPGGLSPEDRARLSSTFSRLARSKEWRALLGQEKQNSFYQPAATFTYFLDREGPRIQALLRDLGLAK